MQDKYELFLISMIDYEVAHSDTAGFKSASFGRFEMQNKYKLFLIDTIDYEVAHSDTVVFQSASFGRFVLLIIHQLKNWCDDEPRGYGCM